MNTIKFYIKKRLLIKVVNPKLPTKPTNKVKFLIKNNRKIKGFQTQIKIKI